MVRRRAYAKVNLLLAVGPKRPDGYHEIATLLCAISLHDTLALTARKQGFALRVDGPHARGVPRTGANLVLKAARALARELGETRGAAIRLTKGVPHGAGLGGGSSDAAATLRGLLTLWGRRLPRARLDALGAELGSDVPFFLGTSPALATGRGEILQPLRPIRPPLRLIVLPSDVPIPTAWAYAKYTIPKTRLTAWDRIVRLLQLRAEVIARSKVNRNFYNDLEDAVLPRVPAVREALAALRASGTKVARMSGSGSAVFGLVASTRSLRRIAAELSDKGHTVYVARSVRAGSRPCR
jgi:4-diphosphocytidyl-2-C-methyl-D-erythritol kinase